MNDAIRKQQIIDEFAFKCECSSAEVQARHDSECSYHAVLDCPHDEPLHYHHDGCPACDLPSEEYAP